MGAPISIDGRWLRFLAWAALCGLVVAAGVGGGMALIAMSPEAEKKEDVERQRPTVEIEVASVVTAGITIHSQGEVRPRRRTSMSAEVAGKLVEVAPALEAGEVFADGDLLLQIDRADYEAAFTAAEATLAEAKLALEMEQVRKAQALRDWAKLGIKGEPSALVRRVPHLASAQARVAAAESAVEKARRDRERTEIRAPYACRVERTYVDLGAVVTPGMDLVDVVSIGPVEVRLPLSLEDYGYLRRGENGRIEGQVAARGKIGGEERRWSGTLVRSEEIVESTTRSINVVAEFNEEESPPIGMFVKAEIVGIDVPEVVRVKRSALRNGSEIFVVTKTEDLGGGEKGGVLELRRLHVMRTERDDVLVSPDPETGKRGVDDGEWVVVTAPGAPVDDLPVKVAGVKKDSAEAEDQSEAAVSPP